MASLSADHFSNVTDTAKPLVEHPLVELCAHPLALHKLTLMRDRTCSTEKFRRLAREIGMYLAFEATKDLSLIEGEVEAPSSLAEEGKFISTQGYKLPSKSIAIVPIIRSGLPIAEGFIEVIPNAKIGHLGLVRGEDYHTITEYYVALPDLAGREVIVIDPIIGTGAIASQALNIIKRTGNAQTKVRFAAILASKQGLSKLAKDHPDVKINCVHIDSKLDENSHIHPGFGDAAQRLFGTR